MMSSDLRRDMCPHISSLCQKLRKGRCPPAPKIILCLCPFGFHCYYYSKAININDKVGYLEINKQENGRYFIEFMYNYSKIEALCDYDDINNIVLKQHLLI